MRRRYASSLLLKWHVFALTEHDAVLFWDVDCELLPLGSHDPIRAAEGWAALTRQLVAHPTARAVIASDYSAPMNTGLMLVRPDRQLFREGRAALRRCAFNTSHGWDLVGPVRSLGVTVLASLRGVATLPGRKVYRHLPVFQQQRAGWDFQAGNSDQGFFLYMLRRGLVFHPSQKHTAAWAATHAHHWIGPIKPQYSHGLVAAYDAIGKRASEEHDRQSWEQAQVANALHGCPAALLHTCTEEQRHINSPNNLLRLYDYVVHAAPGPVTSNPFARACATGQQLVRRAIEAHPNWAQVARGWQRFNWLEDAGVASYAPSLLTEVGER